MSNLQEILNRPEVAAVITWADEAFSEALDLPEYRANKGDNDIIQCACSPTYWLGALEYKKLSRLLSSDELDMVIDYRNQ